jgi:hypothetical protein
MSPANMEIAFANEVLAVDALNLAQMSVAALAIASFVVM